MTNKRLWSHLCTGFVVAAAGVGSVARADRAEELVQIHVEAVGGMARIAALGSLRATGNVFAGGKRMRFTLTAARPDRVRLETDLGGRTLMQAYDGREPPWEFDTGVWPPHYRPMADSAAKTFVADAEFDDPLVAGAARGYSFDYAGEVSVEGKKLLRLLVTRKMTDTFSILLDSETYLVVLRVEQRTSPGGRTVQIVTRYDDFRPVEGVLLSHEVTVGVDGKLSQQTKIDRIDANPAISEEIFSRPKVVLPEARR